MNLDAYTYSLIALLELNLILSQNIFSPKWENEYLLLNEIKMEEMKLHL